MTKFPFRGRSSADLPAHIHARGFRVENGWGRALSPEAQVRAGLKIGYGYDDIAYFMAETNIDDAIINRAVSNVKRQRENRKG